MKNNYYDMDKKNLANQENLANIEKDIDIILTSKLLDFSHSVESMRNNFVDKFRSSLESTLFIFLQEMQNQHNESLRKLIYKQLFTVSPFDSLANQDKEIIAKIFSRVSQHILQKLVF